MKLTIESTDQLTAIDGVPVRLWEGRTESGCRCKVFVHVIAGREGEEAEFERELKALPAATTWNPLECVLRE